MDEAIRDLTRQLARAKTDLKVARAEWRAEGYARAREQAARVADDEALRWGDLAKSTTASTVAGLIRAMRDE